MTSARSLAVAARFGRGAGTYDRHASLQARVARRLATLLPVAEAPRVLEIGCGTGLFTEHLLRRYPRGEFLVTDIAPEMVAVGRARFERRNGRAVRFAVMDGEAPTAAGPFDVVALSMTAQWFADPPGALRRLSGLLAPRGDLVFATLGPGGFAEWRAATRREGLEDGFVVVPPLPGVVREEWPLVDYGTGLAFLRRLRGIGATMPRPGHRPATPAALRRAIARLDADHGACVTWHIVYGRLGAPEARP